MLKVRFTSGHVTKVGLIPLMVLLIVASCNSQKHREAGLLFKDWYVVKPVSGGAGSVSYGRITNEGAQQQVLKKVEFSCAASADLHETIEATGRIRMVSLPQILIAAGETVAFEPGHKHVMLQKIEAAADAKCQAVFNFEAAAIRFSMPIHERKK